MSEQKTKYVLVETDMQAKRATYENVLSHKLIVFPHVDVYIRSTKQLNLLKNYMRYYDTSNIGGVVIPVDRAKLVNLLGEEKSRLLVMIDPLTEILYYDTFKPTIYERYMRIGGLPKEILDILGPKLQVSKEQKNWGRKEIEYSQELDKIIVDKTIKTKLVESIMNANMVSDVDIIIPFSPLIRNNENTLIAAQEIYDYTKRMYLGGFTHVEESLGKRIALYINLHKNVLQNMDMIDKIVKFIADDPTHQALVFKLLITDNSDVRNLSYIEVRNLVRILSTIGQYSRLHGVPSHILCAHTLGLIGLTRGIDSWSQPLTPHIMERVAGFSKEQQENMRSRDPNYQFGRIYCSEVKDFIKYSNYFDIINANGRQLPTPAKEYSGSVNPAGILSLQRVGAWNHAQMTLLESRNYEVGELIKAIHSKEIKGYRSRFKAYFNTSLLPE